MTVYSRAWPAALHEAAAAVRSAATILSESVAELVAHFASTAGVFEAPVADDMRRVVAVRRDRYRGHADAADSVAARLGAAADDIAAKIVHIDARRAARIASGTPPGLWPELDDRWI